MSKHPIPLSPQNAEYASETKISYIRGRIRDALATSKIFMKPYSIPVVRKTDPKKWYVEFYFDVPLSLYKPGSRKRKRFKIYDDINKLEGEQRERYANQLRDDIEYALRNLGYNPFGKAEQIVQKIELEEKLTVEDRLKDTPVSVAIDAYLQSRITLGKEKKTITSYKQVKTWIMDYLTKNGLQDLPISKIKRIHIEEAINAAKFKKDEKTNKEWGPVTYNNQLRNVNTIFNWLVIKEYIPSSPIKGRIELMKEESSIHRWYDKDTAKLVKDALIEAGEINVYRACAFTYWLMIRSRKELHELRVGDIDRKLKRVRFRSEMTKNKSEAFRDYSPEFDKVLDDMEIDKYPAHYYVFGSGNGISENKARKDLIARKFKVVRDKLGLSDDYTIYGWKHTRVCHLMMKGVDGYEISYMARHKDTKSTEAYKRDYDFTLTNVYDEEDLTF